MKKRLIGIGSLATIGLVMALGGAGMSMAENKVISRSEQWAEKYPHQYKSWKKTSGRSTA